MPRERDFARPYDVSARTQMRSLHDSDRAWALAPPPVDQRSCRSGEIEHLRCVEDDEGLVSLSWGLSSWPQQALAVGMAGDEATALVRSLRSQGRSSVTSFLALAER